MNWIRNIARFMKNVSWVEWNGSNNRLFEVHETFISSVRTFLILWGVQESAGNNIFWRDWRACASAFVTSGSNPLKHRFNPFGVDGRLRLSRTDRYHRRHEPNRLHRPCPSAPRSLRSRTCFQSPLKKCAQADLQHSYAKLESKARGSRFRNARYKDCRILR